MAQMVWQLRIVVPFVLLAGCVPSTTQAPPASPASPPSYSMAGLGSVMGRNAAALTARFGAPDLDVREGTARKFQFSNDVCVLDAYLYPPSGRGEAIVTHIDARLPDGRDVDRASCVGALSLRD